MRDTARWSDVARLGTASRSAELSLQGSLFGARRAGVRSRRSRVASHVARRYSWVDHCRHWLVGADDVFAELVDVAAVAPARGDDVGAAAARAAPDVVVGRRRRLAPSRCRCSATSAGRSPQHYRAPVRHHRLQPVPRRPRLGGLARRPRAVQPRGSDRRHRQRRRRAHVHGAPARRRSRRSSCGSATAICS